MNVGTLSEGTISARQICKDIELAEALLSFTVARRPMPAITAKADKIVMRACACGACALVLLSMTGALR